jgi:crotonobetainyl-CoA:carnitine CoA-transferase CaiB-like acyl-CoA transferase
MAEDILSGIRILDFSRVLAGPYATRILGDFGAEVIKVQSAKTAKGVESNSEPYFWAWNRNKRSITLDLSNPLAKDIALKLVAICDVVVENFSPRVMSNWGLNYEKLVEVKSDLIMVGMSGMGQTGPWRDFVAYAPTVQSLGGLTYLTSYNRNSPAGVGQAYADVISGLYCAIAVLSALEYRAMSGTGQYVDLSEYEAVCGMIGPALMAAAAGQLEIFPRGNRSPHIPAAPYGCYRCAGKDRWCVIAVFDNMEWTALCEVMKRPEWLAHEHFSTLAGRKENEEELDSLIEQWTSGHDASWIMKALQDAGVYAGVVQSADDLAHDPQLHARDFFVPLNHPLSGKTLTDRNPIRMNGGSPANWKASPSLGGDNRYVYLELLGLSESEFERYTAIGVFR